MGVWGFKKKSFRFNEKRETTDEDPEIFSSIYNGVYGTSIKPQRLLAIKK
jgi:hypothetical protein